MKLTWKAADCSCMSDTKIPLPVALWLPSMIMMPSPCLPLWTRNSRLARKELNSGLSNI